MVILHYLLGIVRILLFSLDNMVYGLIPILYRLLIFLSNVDLASGNAPVQNMIQRIYILVGVFMLFKLSFSVMNYIVNPDAFSDQAKGFSNLVKRVVIALFLLVSIPWIFQKAYEVQGQILQSGILPRVVLGETTSGKSEDGHSYLEDTIDTSAKDIQFLLFGAFYHINYDKEDFKEGETSVCAPDAEFGAKHIIGTTDMVESGCLEKVAELMDKDDDVIASGVKITSFFRYDEDGKDEREFSKLGDLATWSLESDGDFAINYMFIISTICGGYLVFLLLSFCIDIAGRIIRLLFLQILSPIAVISSVDPTTSGDRLKEWGKECLKVWLSLFVRLLVIYVIIQLVRIITNTLYSGAIGNEYMADGFSNSNSMPVWVFVFLILGVFNAAKKIPELIEKATGIKTEGDLQLNPLKALSENTGLQKGLGFATGVGIGAVGAATGAGAGRIFSGAFQGLTGKNALDVRKTMVEGNRTMRNARSDGSKFGARMRARATNFFGNQGALGKIEDKKVGIENEISNLEGTKAGHQAEKSQIENSIRGTRMGIQNRQAVIDSIDRVRARGMAKAKESDEYMTRMAHAEAYREKAKTMTNDHDREVYLNMASQVEANANAWAAGQGAQEWIENNRDDSEVYDALSAYETAASNAGIAATDDIGDLLAQQGELQRQNTDARHDIAPQESRISQIDEEIRKVDEQIAAQQSAIKDIDKEHRRVQASYTAVGGKSGGTREKNATARSDAGQHYGSSNFFGPHPGGGHGYGSGHGPGGHSS